METKTFEAFRKIIYEESGIVLTPEKRSLLSARVQKRLKKLGIRDESEYLSIIELDVSGEELAELIDTISTNVTYFYRESEHFTQLRQILKKFVAEGQDDIKIWCAAASSGEEPYTIAIEASESLDPRKSKFSILATDICSKVLQKAVLGAYPESIVEKIPEDLKGKYFEWKEPDLWVVKPQLRQKILFKKLNLISQPFPLKGPLHIIFCRNVMIYFDVQTRQKIVAEFYRLLRPGGYLILSHSENLIGISANFEKLGSSIFRKV